MKLWVLAVGDPVDNQFELLGVTDSAKKAFEWDKCRDVSHSNSR